VNAAIYPLHPWLKDAYPEATVTGAVFLSAFTTKSAIYLMARMFPGTELLIYLGAAMAVIPVIYAIVEDDIRRIVAYSLINQGGFMICGIGIGTPLALNGTVSHAFCCILYTALLFMATGSVIQMTGKSKCSELGGLYKTMPLTCIFCIIGAASISALPLFCGFISKSMVVSAASNENMPFIWLSLQCASACACFHAGVKVPFFTFFGKDSGIRSKEPPINMIIAMGISAVLCILIGVFYKGLYQMLPYHLSFPYQPYRLTHIIEQLQVVLFGAFAFYLVLMSGHYHKFVGIILLDTDWFYRKGGMIFYRAMDQVLNDINRICETYLSMKISSAASRFSENAPAKIIIFLMIAAKNIMVMMGSRADALEGTKKKIYEAFETYSTPIGVSVGIASLFIIILFFLS
jgi:multicomponent Na+:H+ antiporter subunit D